MGKELSVNSGAPEKLWNRNFVLVILLGILTQSASQMVTTLISKYAISLGAALTIAATISSTMSIIALICRPFSGVVADRFNRKKIMLISTAVTSVCVLGYAFAPSVSTLVGFRIVHGAAFAFMGVANTAFGATFVPDDRMGEGIGYLSIGSVLAQAVGPSIGLTLSRTYGYSTVFWIAACLSALGFVLLALIPYTYTPDPEASKKKIGITTMIEPRIIFLALILMLFSCGNGLMNTYAALLGEERGIDQIALFFTAYSLATVACRPFVGKLLDKKGLSFIMIPAVILASLAMCFIAMANALWMVIVAGLLKAAGQGSATSSVQGTSIKKLGRDRAGVISSTCYIGMDIANAFAPILGSFVVERSGYTTLFFGYAAILLVGGLGCYALHLITEKKRDSKNA